MLDGLVLLATKKRRRHGLVRLLHNGEVLNAEWFTTTRQAQVVIDTWLRQYNHVRPHHALGMRAPVPETVLDKLQSSGPDAVG